MFIVTEAWLAFNEEGTYTNVYDSLETLEKVEKVGTPIDQGYVIICEDRGTSPDWAEGFYDDYFEALMDLTIYTGGVYVGPDCVAIYDLDGEIVFWEEDEWNEDPTIAVSMANAIRIYYEDGPDVLRGVIGRD